MGEPRVDVSNLPETRVARLTAVGRSAVATVGVFGPSATEQVSQYFRPASDRRLEEIDCGKIIFGRWVSASGPGEELVVCRQRSDHVEVHCHGGDAAVQKIQDALVASGCAVDPGQSWLTSESQDPLSIAAWEAMIDARTRRGALLMLAQYHGALRHRLDEILLAMRAGQQEVARAGLQQLDRWIDVGLHVTQPWKVALLGPPNAGKSSLVNALLGYHRSIVHDQPGTTRDLVSTHTAWDGWPVQLMDTAGLRDDAKGLEQDGINKAWQQHEEVDLVLLVFEGQLGWSENDQRLYESCPGALVVYNKSDLTDAADVSDRPTGILTSTVTDEGLKVLIEKMLAHLVPEPPGSTEAIPFTEGQKLLIRELLQLLDKEQFEDAVGCLDRFLSVETNPEIMYRSAGRHHVDD
jgi:tRNA modification GTPase